MTISLVQLYTALTQILGEKVALGDNGDVSVFVTEQKGMAYPITKLDLIHGDGGTTLEVISIRTGDPIQPPCLHEWQLLPEADAGYQCTRCRAWHSEDSTPPKVG